MTDRIYKVNIIPHKRNWIDAEIWYMFQTGHDASYKRLSSTLFSETKTYRV